jgi:hypothetical protein
VHPANPGKAEIQENEFWDGSRTGGEQVDGREVLECFCAITDVLCSIGKTAYLKGAQHQTCMNGIVFDYKDISGASICS